MGATTYQQNRVIEKPAFEINSENEMESWREKLEFAIDSLNATIWEFDIANDRLISDNKSSVLHGGVTFESYLNLHHPDDRHTLRTIFRQMIAGVTSKLKLEVRLQQPTNSYIWIEIHGQIFQRDQHGKPLKIIGIRRNIQEEKSAHEELVRNKKRVEEYAIQLNLAMKSAGIIVWNYDIKADIFSSPQPNSHIYGGITREQFLSMVHPDDVEIVVSGINNFINQATSSFNYRMRINFPNEGLRWVALNATVLSTDHQGKPTVLTGFKRDITNEHNMTEELIYLRDKADESNMLKSAFLANMSHEIRTPLNAIVGFSNLIAYTEDRKEIDEYIKVIEVNNDLLLQLINDVLDLAKIEAGKLDFNMSEIDVNELLHQLQQMFMMRVKYGVVVKIDMPQSDCYITSERNRLTQVITNFLSNAVKFTTSGTICIACTHTVNSIGFSVSDTGSGIAPENLPIVFDRFSKFDKNVQGTGLGLSICKTIVEKLGGQIGVESTLGMGTKFWFTIPCEVYKQPREQVLL